MFFWPVVLALPSTGRQKKNFWDILFCPIGPKKNFGPIPWQAAEIIGGLLETESQSDRVTEWQTLKGTQYTGGGNIFVPDFNKLPYSLRSQGDDTDGHITQWLMDIFLCCCRRPEKRILDTCSTISTRRWSSSRRKIDLNFSTDSSHFWHKNRFSESATFQTSCFMYTVMIWIQRRSE